MSRVSIALLQATAGVSQSAGSIEWQYHVRLDDVKTGVASPVVAGADGAIYFGTMECVYDMRTCKNATGELVKLDAKTGGEEWSVRFAGAGLTGALGFPLAPVLAGEPLESDFRAIVIGAETLNPADGTFHYFAGSIPLGGDLVSCDVPLASGNRIPHEIAASTADECASAGGCWAAGEDMCALSDTAQTTPCDDVDNPEDEDACTAKGCCFNGGYSPGWCFRASPSCFKPAPAAHSLEQTVRPGPPWISKPVPSEHGHLVVMADCTELLGVPSECGVGAYKSDGGPSLWRVPLLASCEDGGTTPCMCSAVSDRLPPPAVSKDAVYVVACSSEGVVLLGLSLETGMQLWPLQLLGDLFIDSTNAGHDILPPSPVWSSEHHTVYAAIFTSGDAAKVSAHSSSSGKMVWSTKVSGHSCAMGFRWLDAAVVSGDTLLLWDNYTLRALHASSGDAMWQTSSSDFAVVLGSGAPTMLPDSMLVPISYEDPTCSAMEGESFYFAELALSDGTLRGRVAAPDGICPALVTNPVSAGGLWVFSSTTGHPRQSTIFAMKPSAVSSMITV